MEKMQAEFDKNLADLRVLYAMLKVPKMCDLFYKAEKKRKTAE